MRYRVIFLLLTVIVLAGSWSGCSDEFPAGVTAIFGRVVDPTGAPILGVPLVAVFDWRRTAGAPAPALGPEAAAETVQLGTPYPNPAGNPEDAPVRFTVTTPVDTTARVEIWGVVGDISSLIVSLSNGALSGGEHPFSWNGQYETGVSLPNGLYEVRVMVPAGGTGAAAQTHIQPILINRTNQGVVLAEGAYSALTDGDGAYTLNDLPVGEHFTETRGDGTVLGAALVESRVTIFFLDTEYLGGPERVPIGPGEVVDVITELRAVNPAVTLDAEPGPIPAAAR